MLGHGAEFWQYRDGKLALWEAALNVWEAGTDNSTMFLSVEGWASKGPDVVSVSSAQKLGHEKGLADLAPKGTIVTAQTLEGPVIEVSKALKASREVGICLLRGARVTLFALVPGCLAPRRYPQSTDAAPTRVRSFYPALKWQKQ